MSVKNPSSIINCFSPDSNSFLSSSKTPGRGGGKKPRQSIFLSKTNNDSGSLLVAGVHCFKSRSCRHPSRLVRSRPPLHQGTSICHISCPDHLRCSAWGTAAARSRAQPRQWPMMPNRSPTSRQVSQMRGSSPVAPWEGWQKRKRCHKGECGKLEGDTHVLLLSTKPRTRATTRREDQEKLLPRVFNVPSGQGRREGPGRVRRDAAG